MDTYRVDCKTEPGYGDDDEARGELEQALAGSTFKQPRPIEVDDETRLVVTIELDAPDASTATERAPGELRDALQAAGLDAMPFTCGAAYLVRGSS